MDVWMDKWMEEWEEKDDVYVNILMRTLLSREQRYICTHIPKIVFAIDKAQFRQTLRECIQKEKKKEKGLSKVS